MTSRSRLGLQEFGVLAIVALAASGSGFVTAEHQRADGGQWTLARSTPANTGDADRRPPVTVRSGAAAPDRLGKAVEAGGSRGGERYAAIDAVTGGIDRDDLLLPAYLIWSIGCGRRNLLRQLRDSTR